MKSLFPLLVFLVVLAAPSAFAQKIGDSPIDDKISPALLALHEVETKGSAAAESYRLRASRLSVRRAALAKNSSAVVPVLVEYTEASEALSCLSEVGIRLVPGSGQFGNAQIAASDVKTAAACPSVVSLIYTESQLRRRCPNTRAGRWRRPVPPPMQNWPDGPLALD